MAVMRSIMYVPGNNPKMVEKAPSIPADIITLDLEDSVPPSEKEAARKLVAEKLKYAGSGGAQVYVRINNWETEMTNDDLEAVVWEGLDGVTLAKTGHPDDVKRLDWKLEELERRRGIPVGTVKISMLLETAKGIMNAYECCMASSRNVNAIFGAVDYCRDMRVKLTSEAVEQMWGRAKMAIAARAAGIVAIDAPFVAYQDIPAFERNVMEGKQMGYEGRMIIHPSQVEPSNRLYAPDPADVEWANGVVKVFEEEGLAKGVFFRKEDNSVWIDLAEDGLDQKLLLRGDGTSVYMTQDLGTAYRRFEENRLDDMIYVVGNEQNYHFQVLKLILKKLGYADWSDHITHLSYGMVELPEGKMKSREGMVVDADDLIADMVSTAREMSDELGKLDGCTEEEADAVSTMVGLGALKYFILKVDPKKTMLFDPRESIDFNGNTGPFIQYTHARICSVLRKAAEAGIDFSGAAQADYLPEEIALVKSLTEYPSVVAAAGENFAPSIIGAYVYELAKQFNGYYHDHSILKEENDETRRMRLQLAQQVARVIRSGMKLLGIDVPARM